MSPAGHCGADPTFRGSQGKSVSGGSFADSPSYSGAMWGGHALEQLHKAGAATVLLLPAPPSLQHLPGSAGPLPACARLLLGGQGRAALRLTASETAFSGSPDCCPPAAPPREKRKSSELAAGRACHGDIAPDRRKPPRPRDSAERSCLCDGAQPQQAPLWGPGARGGLGEAGEGLCLQFSHGSRCSLAIPAPGAWCSGCRVVLDTGAAAGPQDVVRGLSLPAVGKGCKVHRLFTCIHMQTEQIWVPLISTGLHSHATAPSQGTHGIQSTGSGAGLHSSEHLITQSL